mgnify:CR=1 FL=1
MLQLNFEAKAVLLLDNVPGQPKDVCLDDQKIIVTFLRPVKLRKVNLQDVVVGLVKVLAQVDGSWSEDDNLPLLHFDIFINF